MGRCLQRQNSIGRLEQARVLCVVKLPRNDGNIIGNNIISDDSKKQERANTVGQHYINRLCKPQGWAVSNTFTNSHINLGRSGQQWDVHSMRAYCRSQKPCSRLLVAYTRQAQLDASPQTLFVHRSDMGPSHNRPICKLSEYTTPSVQQSLLRTTLRGYRRAQPRQLVAREQLCKRSILSHTKGSGCYRIPEGSGHGYSPKVASSSVVSEASKTINRKTFKITPNVKNIPVNGRDSGTTPKYEMANFCLEDIWRTRLTRLGWSPSAIDRFELSWARGTLRSYNNILLQLYEYCHENDIHFPPVKSAGLANFLCTIANKSQRPQSILRTASAAIGHLYKAKGLENLVQDESLQRLITALVKSGTECPMTRSNVMPVENFHKIFTTWPENETLSVKDLRLKTVTFLALTLMLRLQILPPMVLFFMTVRA